MGGAWGRSCFSHLAPPGCRVTRRGVQQEACKFPRTRPHPSPHPQPERGRGWGKGFWAPPLQDARVSAQPTPALALGILPGGSSANMPEMGEAGPWAWNPPSRAGRGGCTGRSFPGAPRRAGQRPRQPSRSRSGARLQGAHCPCRVRGSRTPRPALATGTLPWAAGGWAHSLALAASLALAPARWRSCSVQTLSPRLPGRPAPSRHCQRGDLRRRQPPRAAPTSARGTPEDPGLAVPLRSRGAVPGAGRPGGGEVSSFAAQSLPPGPGSGRRGQPRLRVARAVGCVRVSSSLWPVAGWWRKEGTAAGAGRGRHGGVRGPGARDPGNCCSPRPDGLSGAGGPSFGRVARDFPARAWRRRGRRL